MTKKPKEPTSWSTSANGQTSHGGSGTRHAKGGCKRIAVSAAGAVLTFVAAGIVLLALL